MVEARARVLGNDHPATLTSMSNYAVTLGCLGRYEQEEAVERQVGFHVKHVMEVL